MQNRKEFLDKIISSENLSDLDNEIFLDGWRAVAYLNPGLHPDGFECEGSGWPNELKPMAEEAWRRYEAGIITDDEMYCYEEAYKRIEEWQNSA